ncbi:alpha/beta hydrolase [Gordonia malaquae]|uniref:alpha/beta fold hydrolase n=1 Tax=Gordonia malaquae TaxID=410332 RepID=UPI003017F0FA
MRVVTGDGAVLHVHTEGAVGHQAHATVVLTHGFCMSGASWARVRQGLCRQFPDLRVVTYDHRGHGRSTSGTQAHSVAQLAADLDAVIGAAAPSGPLLLAGHSLGAMALLEHLSGNREILARLSGVAIIASAAGGLTECGLGRMLPPGIVRSLPRAAKVAPSLFEAIWAATRSAATPMLGRRHGHHNRPTARVLAEIAASLMTYDVRAGLDVLAAVPTRVLVGEHDRITPVQHAHEIARSSRGAVVTVIPGGGHNLPVERPSVVVDALSELLGHTLGRPWASPSALSATTAAAM